MGSIMNALRGWARVELACRYSERAVNICARNHVEFWDLKRTPEGAAQMSVSLPGYVKLRQVARETGAFTVKIVRRSGAPFFLWRLRRRYVLLAGLLLCVLLTGLSSVFIWQIDVTGNQDVPSSKILAALKGEGVDIGKCVLNITEQRVADRILLQIPELSFITLNNHGSRLEVIVREKRPVPELYDPDIPTAVFARKAGIITETTVLEGWRTAEPGDTVDVGDRLIASWVPLGAGRLTHASGSVWARTWYEMSMEMPLKVSRKTYTGERSKRLFLLFGGKRINLYFLGGNPYAGCDKITVYKKLTLPGGTVLPLTVARDTFEEYTLRTEEVSPEEAERVLSARLTGLLEEQIGQGWVVSRDFETRAEDGLVTVTLRAECVEEIGLERALTPEEIAAEKAGQPQP